MEVENRLITLNSVNGIRRNTTLLSDIYFNFQNILSDDPDIISSNICIMNAQIPVSFYIINSTNNSLQVNTLLPSPLTASILIPPGNYTANSYISTINTLLAAAGSPVSVSFSNITGKLTLTSSAGGSILVLYSVPTAIYSGVVFGFGNATFQGLSPITMPYPLNLLGVKRLSIKSQLLGVTSFNSGTNQSTILATIPNNNAPYTMINYENLSNLNKSLVRIRKIDAIDIQIEDENGLKIDFNNTDWSITLVLENIRRMTITEVPHFMKILEQQNEAIPPEVYGD